MLAESPRSYNGGDAIASGSNGPHEGSVSSSASSDADIPQPQQQTMQVNELMRNIKERVHAIETWIRDMAESGVVFEIGPRERNYTGAARVRLNAGFITGDLLFDLNRITQIEQTTRVNSASDSVVMNGGESQQNGRGGVGGSHRITIRRAVALPDQDERSQQWE